MTKAELKNGMGVIFRNGWCGVVVRDCATKLLSHNNLFVSPGGGFNTMSDYSDDLTECKYCDPDYDIVKVVKFNNTTSMVRFDTSFAEVLWERKEPKELTIEEIEELLGYPIKVVK